MPTLTPPTSERAPVGAGEGFLRAALAIETDQCIIWPYGCRDGYPVANIVLPDGRRRPEGVHVLICERVYGPRSPGMEASHSCGNPLCVNPAHLRWATHKQNCADRALHGTENRGQRNGHARLTEDAVREIRALWANGCWTQTELAAEFQVRPQTVSKVVHRRRWAHVA